MALTLDATLLAAQTATSRKPLCSLIAKRGVSDIPLFKNAGFAVNAAEQRWQCAMVLSDGRIVVFYCLAAVLKIYMVVSDTGRTAFGNPVEIMNNSGSGYCLFGSWPYYPACIEISPGVAGLVFWVIGWHDSMMALRININGTSFPTNLLTQTFVFSHGDGTTPPRSVDVYKQQDGVFAMVYMDYNYRICRRISSDFISWGNETVLKN